MPDLKIKLEQLIADAADCQLIGDLAADPAKRDEFRKRAEQFRLLAEQVRAQIGSRPRTDIEFLIERAAQCRSLAAGLADDDMKADLIGLAAELEAKAAQEKDV